MCLLQVMIVNLWVCKRYSVTQMVLHKVCLAVHEGELAQAHRVRDVRLRVLHVHRQRKSSALAPSRPPFTPDRGGGAGLLVELDAVQLAVGVKDDCAGVFLTKNTLCFVHCVGPQSA